MNQIGISVVIPCYNCESTIERCLDSLKACNYENYELILINDNSVDETDIIIRRYVASNPDCCIRYYCNKQNLGAGETRNKGIQLVSKEYLVFVDSDDTVEQLFFERIGNVASEKDSDCIIFNVDITDGFSSKGLEMFYGGGFVCNESIAPKKALVYTKGCTAGKAYKVGIIKNNNIRFATIKRNEDCVFTKTALSFCKSVFYIKDVLYHYFDNPQSLMHDNNLLDMRNAFIAYDLIKDKLINRGFNEELHSIFLIEVIYSTTLTCIKQGGNAKRHFKIVVDGYSFKDKYYGDYGFKYKTVITLLRLHFLWLIKRLI